MSEEQLHPYVGQLVTASLRDGTTITGLLHDRSTNGGLTSLFAIEYSSPQKDSAYTDNRYHPIATPAEVVSLERAS